MIQLFCMTEGFPAVKFLDIRLKKYLPGSTCLIFSEKHNGLIIFFGTRHMKKNKNTLHSKRNVFEFWTSGSKSSIQNSSFQRVTVPFKILASRGSQIDLKISDVEKATVTSHWTAKNIHDKSSLNCCLFKFSGKKSNRNKIWHSQCKDCEREDEERASAAKDEKDRAEREQLAAAKNRGSVAAQMGAFHATLSTPGAMISENLVAAARMIHLKCNMTILPLCARRLNRAIQNQSVRTDNSSFMMGSLRANFVSCPEINLEAVYDPKKPADCQCQPNT